MQYKSHYMKNLFGDQNMPYSLAESAGSNFLPFWFTTTS